jgi:hypothetical protein
MTKIKNKSIEMEFKEEQIAIEKEKPKKKGGRPKGVKNGQGKKKVTRKKAKASEKTGARTSRLKPAERESYRQKITEYFGASKIDKALLAAKTVKDLDPILIQFKKKMEAELEDEKRDVEEYYKKIDAEYKTVGRPKSVFNEKELKYLCSIHCTLEEIAGFFQMNKQVLSRKIKEEYNISWTEFYERNSQGSKVSLRRRQIQAAMEGDTQMLKFLGKNMLGQKEKVEFDGEVKVNSWVDLITNIDPDALTGNKEDNGNDAE